MKKNGCGCGCSNGSCGGCCNGGSGSSFVQKFSGLAAADSEGAGTTSYLADRGNGASVGVLSVSTEYPVSLSRKVKHLVVDLQDALVGDATLTVNLTKNGVAVEDAFVSFGGSNPLSGTRRVKLDVHLAPSDTYGLNVVTTGDIAAVLSLSAEIAGKLNN